MKAGLALICLLALAGCGTKAVVQPLKGSSKALPRYSGPVCLLPKPLPPDVKFTPLGRAVANQQWYGGFAKVNRALAEVARSVGADAVVSMRSHMKMGFIAVARPQSWGYAIKLQDPESFDCLASGGRYDGIAPVRPAPSARALPAAPATPASPAYDACMARVLRIGDPALRLQAMDSCDAAK